MIIPKSLTTVTPFSKFLAMGLFLLLPFVGFLIGMRYQETIDSAKTQSSPAPIISPKQTSTVASTANWKTYTNKKYGFSIKYPNNFKLCLNDFCTNKNVDNIQHVQIIKKEYGEFYLLPLKNLTGLNVNQIGKRAYNCTSTQDLVSNLNENGVFLGLSSYEFDVQNGFCDEGYLISVKDNMSAMINGDGSAGWVIKEKHHVIFLERNGMIYRIIYPKNAEFDQILSTFKFTDQEQVACTQDAKLCPDGKTSVGRTGPNCEFTLCP